jgi:transposase
MVLPAEVEDLIASLRGQIAALQAEVADLRRQLGQDSSTSSKPPSSDGLKKRPRIAGSLRGSSGKASGGQKGHKGGALRQVADPDCVIEPMARACGHCGSPLDPKSAVRIEKRQVFDLAERPLMVTEHQAAIYRCAHCRGETRAAFPEGVVSPTQYGERMRAAAVYLNVQQLLPEDRTAQALSDLFDAPLICPASIVAWVGKKAQALRQVYQHIGVRVAEPKVRHLDDPSAMLKRGFASPANCNGCTRLRAWPSPSIAPAKNAAPSRKICTEASSCTTTSCLTAGSTRSITPSATPISCANSTA